MELNKNLEAALEKLEASEEDKEILRTILYKEHLNREHDWDSNAPKEIKDLMHDACGGEEGNHDID